MNAAMIILGKDLRLRLRDSALFVFAIALPLGLAFVFNLVLGDADKGFTARYAVADADRGELARQFTDNVLRPLEKSGVITLRSVATAEDGTGLVARKEIDAAFVIPAGFSADIAAGRSATLQVVGNVDSAVAVQVAREIAAAYAAERRGVALSVAVVRGGQPATVDDPELAQRVEAVRTPVALAADPPTARRQLDSATYHAAGMAYFFLFFSLLFTVTGILDERSGGTLSRLLAAPIPTRSILVGKLAGGALLGVASMAVLVVASSLFLGARWGDPVGVAALILAGVLAATGIMAVVAVFAKTSEQASNWQSTIAMVLGVFGGALFPVAQLGGLSAFSYLTPHGWFLRGLANLADNGSLLGVVVPVAALLGFAVLAGGLAMLRAGRLVRA